MTINARTVCTLLLAAAFLSLAAPLTHAQKPPDFHPVTGTRLSISGSSTIAPLVSAIAQRFESTHTGIKIEVQSVGSGKGIADLRAGACDIALISRPLLDTERELFYFPIARDGVAVIVHRDNRVKDVTAEQLTNILIGRITNWKALGGRDAPINLIGRGKGQGSTEIILSQLHLKIEQFRRRQILLTNSDAIKAVAADPNAVTLTSVGESERGARAGVPIKLLSYNGVAASSTTVRKNIYDLSRPLALATRSLPQGLQKQFIDYAISDDVVDLHVKYDFVPYE
jgi:phosphate transport system substrate-binding protein